MHWSELAPDLIFFGTIFLPLEPHNDRHFPEDKGTSRKVDFLKARLGLTLAEFCKQIGKSGVAKISKRNEEVANSGGEGEEWKVIMTSFASRGVRPFSWTVSSPREFVPRDVFPFRTPRDFLAEDGLNQAFSLLSRRFKKRER